MTFAIFNGFPRSRDCSATFLAEDEVTKICLKVGGKEWNLKHYPPSCWCIFLSKQEERMPMAADFGFQQVWHLPHGVIHIKLYTCPPKNATLKNWSDLVHPPVLTPASNQRCNAHRIHSHFFQCSGCFRNFQNPLKFGLPKQKQRRLLVLRINETTHQPPTNAQQKQWYYPQNCSCSLESWPSLLLSNFFSTFCSLLVTNILGWPVRQGLVTFPASKPTNQPWMCIPI